MRRIYYVLLSALIAVLFGCDNKDKEVTYISNLAEVIQDIAGVPAEGLTQEITFTAATAWRSETEDEWAIISPERGEAGVNKVTITINPSTESDPRSMLVRFTESAINHDFKISQQSGIPIDRKVVVERMTIVGGQNVFTPIDVIEFSINEYNYVSGYMLRIKANFDWVIDATTIPSVFSESVFLNRDGKPYSADKGVYTPDFTIEVDQTKLTTEPQSVRVAVKDKITGTLVWIPITVPGLGDNYVEVIFNAGFNGRVELRRTEASPVTFQLAQSPSFDYKFVALERVYNADNGSYTTTLNEVDWVKFGKPVSKSALIKTAHTISAVDNPTGADRYAEVFLLPKNVTVNESIELDAWQSASVKKSYWGRVYQLRIDITQFGPNEPVQFSFDNSLTEKTVTYTSAETVLAEDGGGNIVKYTSNYTNKGSETKHGLYLKINEADTTGWNCAIGFGFDRDSGSTPKPCIDIVLSENKGPQRQVPVEVWVRYKDLTTEKIGKLTVIQQKK